MADETVILRVQLDSAGTEKRLQELVLDIEKTKLAQQALNKARKENAIDEAAYSEQVVRLRTQLKAQTTEQTALTKNLELYRASVNGVAGSYDQVQSQLLLAQRQFRGLTGSSKDSTDETKALSAVIRELRGELKSVDSSSLDQFYRFVGQYPKGSFEDLVKQLAKLRAEEKNLSEGTEAFIKNKEAQIGFMTSAQRAAAEEGKSYEQATKAINNLAAAYAPAVEKLVKLEQAQARIVESGGEASEAYRKIGFQVAAATKAVDEATPPTQSFTGALVEAASETDTLGGVVQKATGIQAQWVQIQNLSRLAMGASTGAARVLKLAIAATGIGLLIVAIGTLITYFTQTAEGARTVEKVMAAIGATVDVVVDRIAHFGTAVQQFLSGDTQAALKTTREAFKGIGDEIAREAEQAYRIVAAQQELLKQERALSVERAKGKATVESLKLIAEDTNRATQERIEAARKAFGIEIEQEQKAVRLQQQKLDLLIQQQSARDGNLSDEDLDARAEAEKALYEIQENARTRQIELNNKINELASAGRDQQLADSKAYWDRQVLLAQKGSNAELQARLGVIRAERATALAADNLTANQRRLINTQAEKQISETRLEYRRNDLQQQLGLLDVELQQVKNNSDEQLNLLVRRLDTQHRLDLAQANLTIGQRQVLNAKYEADKLKLAVDFERQRSKAMLQATSDETQARIALLQQADQDAAAAVAAGNQQAVFAARQRNQQLYELQRQAVKTDLELQLAALDVREDNTAKEAALRQQAEVKLQALRRDNATAALELDRRELEERARLFEVGTNDLLVGLTEQERRRVQLSDEYVRRRKLAIFTERDALVKGTQDGSAERLRIEQETADKIAQLDQETVAGRKQQAQESYNKIIETVQQSLNSLAAIQEAGKTQALARDSDQLKRQLEAAGDNAERREAIEKEHAKNRERISLDYARKQQRVAIAQAAIDGSRAVMKILAETPKFDFGILTAIQIAAAIALTGAQISTINSQRFAEGGAVLAGPSHAQGGIPFTVAGRPGFEAEGGEIILTRGVWASPLLRPMASFLNVAGGGKPLVPGGRHMALGGVAQSSVVRESLRADVDFDYSALGEAVADAIRRKPIGAVVSQRSLDEGRALSDFTTKMTDS